MAKPKQSSIAIVPRKAASLERVDDPPPKPQEVRITFIVRRENRDWHRIIYASLVGLALLILAVGQVV